MDSQALKDAGRYGAMLLISIALFACNKQSKVPYYDTPNFTPIWTSNSKVIDTMHTIAPFAVTDQDGKEVTNKTFDGKYYVADFFFTSCPGICPKLTIHMKMLADSFANNDKVKFISYSVTPDIDSVARLHAYAADHGIKERQWHLVTGRMSDIYDLARKSYYVEKEIGLNRDSTEFLHTEHFILVDEQGHIRGIYNGTVELEVQRLGEDIKDLLAGR